MTELKGELSDLNPRNMLDFGSGPGTAALAVWDVWGMEGGKVVDEDGEERWEEGQIFQKSLLYFPSVLIDSPKKGGRPGRKRLLVMINARRCCLPIMSPLSLFRVSVIT